MAHTPDDPTKAQVWITKGIDDLDFEFYFPQGPKGDPGGLVMGTDILLNNLNDYKTSGVYRQPLAAEATQIRNYPAMTLTAGGILLVHQRDSGGAIVFQEYQPTSGSYDVRVTYKRLCVNGTWTAWRAYTSSRTDQTAGRVMYHWDELNAREQLIYGDTGVRRVETLFMNGWTAAIASLRRTNNIVQLGLYTVSPTAKTADIAWQVPAGFRPGSYGGNIAFPCRSLAASGNGWVTVSGSGDVLPDLVYSTFNGSIQLMTWITSDAWPTTLPGTASGSIPNL